MGDLAQAKLCHLNELWWEWVIGFELVRPLICVSSKPVVNITLEASSLQQP